MRFIDDEVKAAIFSIPEDKSPGLDGYSSAFYKPTWNVTDPEITTAVKEFFDNGKFLREINKVKCPDSWPNNTCEQMWSLL